MIGEAQEQNNRLSSEIDKYIESMEKERESFYFIKIEFLVDMRIAESQYKDEYKNNTGGIKDSRLSFNQWLDYKKYEASKFYMKHSDYYLGF